MPKLRTHPTRHQPQANTLINICPQYRDFFLLKVFLDLLRVINGTISHSVIWVGEYSPEIGLPPNYPLVFAFGGISSPWFLYFGGFVFGLENETSATISVHVFATQILPSFCQTVTKW